MKVHSKAVLIIGLISLSLLLGATKDPSRNNISSETHKTDLSMSQIPLQGLKSVYVVFVGCDPNLEKSIREDIESKLLLDAREQGFISPSIVIMDKFTPGPYFLSRNSDTQGCTTIVRLYDAVLLARNSNIRFRTVTWERIGTPFFEEENRFEKQRESILDSFTSFLNDYIAANLKDADIKTDKQGTK
jgi:hypothetical protein